MSSLKQTSVLEKRDLAIQFSEQMLTYLKQILFANKSTFQEDLLNRCVALYEQVYRHAELQGETDTILPYWSKLMKRWNIVCKQDANGVALDPSDRKSQIGLRSATVCPLLYQDHYQPFLDYATAHVLRTLPGIPVSFLLPLDSPYTELLWRAFQYLFQTTQILIGSPIDLAFSTRCEEQISSLELMHQIGLLLRDDPYLNTILYSPTKDVKGIRDQATQAMRDAGITNESVFEIVDEATNQLFERSGGDVSNINSAETTMHMLKSAKDIMKRKGSALKGCDTRKTMAQLLESLQTVSSKGTQLPTGITNLVSLAQVAIGGNDPESAAQLEKMTAEMGLTKEMVMKMMQ